jgi:ABC-type dipeptide/oligopeptide/nickel transport system permease component
MLNREYQIVPGVVLLGVVFVVGVNLLVDLADPFLHAQLQMQWRSLLWGLHTKATHA